MNITGVIVLLLFVAQLLASPSANQTLDVQAALDHISGDSLRGHLSFIASDALEGRGTPSRGLDLAAEYLAAQFRRAGLEPVGDDGYFQTAPYVVVERDMDDFEMTVFNRKETISVGADQISLISVRGLTLSHAPLFKIDSGAMSASPKIRGSVVITELDSGSSRAEIVRRQNELLSKMQDSAPALVILISRVQRSTRPSGSRLLDPVAATPGSETPRVPVVSVHDSRLIQLYDSLKPGRTGVSLSLRLSAPTEKSVKLRNVIGVLRGSDPALRDTYVLVTAHYDHLGMQPMGDGDRIYNGANDDGSGTVSVIELASAFATLKTRPKRSLVFMTFFGEERGLLGSRHYGRHPVFPIEKTVANINIEQVGRTDSTEGPQVGTASVTGFDFSEVGDVLRRAGEMAGVRVYKHEQNSDAYFSRSDNQALADLGVPAHTLCVAYAYPDYHGVGDHWDKIDYDNLAKVNRMIGLALLMIANDSNEPRWNESNPKTTRYVKAWKERRGN